MDRKELKQRKMQLEKELKQVQEELDVLNVPKQKLLKDIDFSKLATLVDEIMDDYKEDGRSKDDEYRVYEAVMEAFFGEDFWDWLNEKMG